MWKVLLQGHILSTGGDALIPPILWELQWLSSNWWFNSFPTDNTTVACTAHWLCSLAVELYETQFGPVNMTQCSLRGSIKGMSVFYSPRWWYFTQSLSFCCSLFHAKGWRKGNNWCWIWQTAIEVQIGGIGSALKAFSRESKFWPSMNI
jgi:hypothetical protein